MLEYKNNPLNDASNLDKRVSLWKRAENLAAEHGIGSSWRGAELGYCLIDWENHKVIESGFYSVSDVFYYILINYDK